MKRIGSLLIMSLFVASILFRTEVTRGGTTIEPSHLSRSNAISLQETNQVLEWNQIFIDTLIATNTANSSSQRLGAIVHTAIFDATMESNDGTRRFLSTMWHLLVRPVERP